MINKESINERLLENGFGHDEADFIVYAINSHDALRTIVLRYLSLNEMEAEIERINKVLAQAEQGGK